MLILIAWLIFTVPAWNILTKKERGAGYYVLAIFFPLIGLIVALCLKNLTQQEDNSVPPTLDITDEAK